MLTIEHYLHRVNRNNSSGPDGIAANIIITTVLPFLDSISKYINIYIYLIILLKLVDFQTNGSMKTILLFIKKTTNNLSNINNIDLFFLTAIWKCNI